MPCRYENFIVSRLWQAESNRLTAFKTISMRIRGAKTELEEAGLETEGMADSTAKLREEMLALSGVDIMLNDNEFKSTYQIMEELANKWQDLSDIQQASVTELIAGKRQGNIVSSLMNNFDIAEDALETSLDSSGSAMEEHGKYMDSLEAKLSQLKAAWQGFSQTFMDSDILKGGVSFLVEFLDLITKLIDNFGLLGTAGLGVMGFGIFKNMTKDAKEAKKTLADVVDAVNNVVDAISVKSTKDVDVVDDIVDSTADAVDAVTDSIESVSNVVESISDVSEAVDSIDDASDSLENVIDVVDSVGDIADTTDSLGDVAEAIDSIGDATKTLDSVGDIAEVVDGVTDMVDIADTVDDVVDSTMRVVDASADGALAMTSLGEAVASTGGKFKAFIKSPMGAAMAIGAVVAVLGVLYNGYKKGKEEASKLRQEHIQASDEFLDSAINFEQAYIKYSGKTNLTLEEESELTSAIQGTVDALGNKSSALQNAVDSSNDYLASLESIKDAELDAAKDAAELKREEAKVSLREAAIGWESFDGSEVNVDLGTNQKSEAVKIANEMESAFVSIEKVKGSLEKTKFTLSADADINEIIDYYDFLIDYREKLEEADLIDTGEYEEVNKAIDKMSDSIDTYIDGVYEAAKANYQFANGIPKTVDEYLKMREAILNDENVDGLSFDKKLNIVDMLDSEFGQMFDLASAEAQARKFVGLIKGYGNGTKDGTNEIGTVETFLNMRTAVNNGECTVGQYLSEFNKVTSMAENFSDEERQEFNLAFGIDTDTIKKQYDELKIKLTDEYYDIGMSNDNAEEFLNNLSYKELSASRDLFSSNNEEFRSVLKNYQDVLNEAEQSSVDFSKTVFGNIDTNARKTLEWTSKNLSEYKDELMSWEPEDTSWDSVKKGYENTISTVMGGWDTFEIDEKKVDIAFSPILQTDSGAELLSSDTVGNYINGLISKATEDGEWTNEELLKLDSEGIEIDGKKIQGILADIGDTAEATSMQMHFVGKDGALAMVEDELFAIVEKQAKLNDAMNFSINITAEKEGIEAFNTALTESVSAMGLSSESLDILKSRFSELDSYDPSKLFEKTSQGIHLNREEFNKLEEELADSKLEEIDESLETVTDAYEDVTEKIRTCSSETERQSLLADQLSYANKIEELSEMQAQYEGLTSAYNKWINAQESGEEGDMYDSAIEGIASAKELYEKGLVGTNEFAAAVEFMSGQDTSSMNVDQIVAAYDEAIPKMNRYFQESANGAQNLLNDLNGINEEWAHINDDGDWELDIPIETAAKELGISVDALESILGKASDYGLEINYDSVYEASESLETLYTEAETANEKLKELGQTDVTFSFESTDVEDLTSQIEEAQKIIEKIKEADLADDGEINLSVEGAEQAKTVLETLMRQKQEVTKPAFMEVSYSVLGDAELGNAIRLIQNLQTYKNVYDIQVAVDADTSETEAKIQSVIGEINTLKTENPEIFANLNLNTEEFNSALDTLSGNIEAGVKLDPSSLATVQSSLNSIDANVLASVGIGDTSSLNNLNGQATITPFPSTLDLGDNFTGNATITPKAEFTDFGNIFKGSAKITPSLTSTTLTVNVKTNPVNEAFGTAHAGGSASGRAFAHGNWSIGGNGVALGGELGQELVVRDGRFFTIGDNGAEFFRYKPNDIIFNAAQTESLFKYGGIKGANPRGKMLATGSAFAEGRAFAYNDEDYAKGGGGLYGLTSGGSKSSSSSSSSSSKSRSSSSKSSSSSSKEAEKEFEETIDWIETAIDRIERAIDQLDTKANSVYRTWSERNTELTKQISEVGNEIALQQKAYDEYIKEANSVGLSEAYAAKVRDGTIDIETITDEDLAEKIKSYTEWYEKALDCQDAILELTEAESELYAQRFENIQSQYDGILQGFEHTEAMLNEYISQAEENGRIVSQNYYQALIDNENARIDELKKQQLDLIKARDEAVNSGKIAKYSEEWYNMCGEIDSVTQAIEEGNTAIIEYGNSIREIGWEVFDLIQERISAVSEEADFLIELMSNDKLFDNNGNLTSQGVATMGLHAQKYNDYMYQADDYGAEISNLDAQIEKDPYDQELINRRNELIELQREMILAAEDEKNAIRDMVEEGINLELDALQELIDKKNEELESQKDLYEYQKKVKEQTKEIASLEKQMSAYSGDNSEEAKAKVQELKVSLEEAKADLQETEWDKYINDTSILLDDLYLEYENILNQRLDNVDYLLQQVVDGVNATMGAGGIIDTALSSDGAIAQAIINAVGENGSIKNILNDEATSVGTTLSTAMNSIWTADGSGTNSILSTYGKGFQDKQTTTNATLDNIKVNINAMVDDVDKDANKKVAYDKTSTSANQNEKVQKPSINNTTNSTPTNTTTTATNTIKVGGKINAGSAKIYDFAGDTSGERQYYRNDPIYTVISESNGYLKVRYHKLSSGVTGWFKKSDVKAYASGKKNLVSDETAWTQENGMEFIVRPSDGAILTPIAKGDSVLNANASRNIWDMANSPVDFIKDNLNLGGTNIPNNSNVNNNYTQNLESVVFNLPNVQNYNELLSSMQKDKNFEKLILSMSVDRLAGKSSLAKNKSIR